jgi:antitoxin component YwqK of YwqJK toxin-antitoxin module
MKNLFLIILFLLVFTNIQAQQYPKFNDLIEITDNGNIKYYLSKTFQIAHKNCSEYYMINQFNKEYFELKDSIKVFYNDDKLYLKGNFIDGKKNGLFIWYHKNGQVECTGEYSSDKRIGMWNYYYSNGNLHKKVNFIEDYELLVDFYEENGTHSVENGNGTFRDEILISTSNTTPSIIKGDVVEGIQNGKWEIHSSGIKIATEYFENKSFIKGISHSIKFGNSEYYDHINSTFSGIFFLEKLHLITPSICGNGKHYVSYVENFFENLKKNYNNSDLKNKILNNWFLVELAYNKSNEAVKIEIYSTANSEVINLLKEIILKSQKKSIKDKETQNSYKYFPLVILDKNVYLPHDKEVELLRFKY